MIERYEGQWTERKSDWLERAVIAGFLATVLMTSVLVVAYVIAALIGSDSPRAPLLLRWTWGIAHNVVTAHAQTAAPVAVLLHFVFGLNWAIFYAAVAEPRLRGAGWRRGLLFAPIPWAFSVLIFLPIVGGGVLGLGLGAGPLPMLGNLILHLVYGVTLGSLYPPESDHALIERGESESAEEVRIYAHTKHLMALGIIVGLGLGGLGGWIGGVVFAPDASALVALTIGALAGSVSGMLIGSFSGLSPQHP